MPVGRNRFPDLVRKPRVPRPAKRGAGRFRVAEPGNQLDEPPEREPVVLDLEFSRHLPDEGAALVGAEHRETSRQADIAAEAPQQVQAERVKRGDPRQAAGLPDFGTQGLHPRPHLARRLVREGDGEDGFRRRPVHEHSPADPVRNHPGLARTGPGEHHSGSGGSRHRFLLGGVEAVEDRVPGVLPRAGPVSRHGQPFGARQGHPRPVRAAARRRRRAVAGPAPARRAGVPQRVAASPNRNTGAPTARAAASERASLGERGSPLESSTTGVVAPSSAAGPWASSPAGTGMAGTSAASIILRAPSRARGLNTPLPRKNHGPPTSISAIRAAISGSRATALSSRFAISECAPDSGGPATESGGPFEAEDPQRD